MNNLIINDSTIDYLLFEWLEGTLDPDSSRMVEQAVNSHPRWQETLVNLRLSRIDKTAIPAMDATLLYRQRKDKSPNSDNFDEFAVALTEGILSDDEEKKFVHFLQQHPEKAKDLEQYQKARMVADPDIFFPNKAQLKKPVSRVVPLKAIYASLAVAASLAALFTLLHPFTREPLPLHPQPVAVVPAPSPSDTLQLNNSTTVLTPKADTVYRKQIAYNLTTADTTARDSIPTFNFYQPEPLLQAALGNPSTNLLANQALIPSAMPENVYSPQYGKYLLSQPTRVLHAWRNRDIITIDGPSLLQAGIARVAYWTGTDMRLEYHKGDDGKVKKIEFYSPLVAYESTFYRNR